MLFAPVNQPVRNVLYMFPAAGRGDRTQYWVHRVLNELYGPDNFAGDEETGAMAAWYILSSLGLFALCPGKPELALGAPLFPSAEIRFSDGRAIRIDAHRRQTRWLLTVRPTTGYSFRTLNCSKCAPSLQRNRIVTAPSALRCRSSSKTQNRQTSAKALGH
jgi:hypothetical protein